MLHEVLATHRAASTAAVDLDGIVLVTPERPDPSTGLNAGELGRVLEVPVVALVGTGHARRSSRARTKCGRSRERLARAWQTETRARIAQ